MSAAIDWVRIQKPGSPKHKLVLYAVSFYSDWETGVCPVNLLNLAEDTELPYQDVERCLQDLDQAGFVRVLKSSSSLDVVLCGYAEWIASIPQYSAPPVKKEKKSAKKEHQHECA